MIWGFHVIEFELSDQEATATARIVDEMLCEAFDGIRDSDSPGIAAAPLRTDWRDTAEAPREAPPLPVTGFDHRLGMWK